MGCAYSDPLRIAPAGTNPDFRFCSAETKGFSLAHRDVLNFFRYSELQFSEAEGLICPVSKSSSRARALGKPRCTISSKRMGRISSGRSAALRRNAADSLEDRGSRKCSRLRLSAELAIDRKSTRLNS